MADRFTPKNPAKVGFSLSSTLSRLEQEGAYYALLIVALFIVFGAAIGIADGLSRLSGAGQRVEQGYLRIAAAEQILSIARDAESAQRGYLITGQERFLEPHRKAMRRAPAAWANLERLTANQQRASYQHMRTLFDEKEALNLESLAMARAQGLPAARAWVGTGRGKAKMDELRREVGAFSGRERAALVALKQDAESTFRDAMLQVMLGSIALVLAGVLLYSAIRRERNRAGQNADMARVADQRFRATFEQAGVGMIHLTPKGQPIIVNDALCEMTGYSRQDFIEATSASSAHPMRLLADPELRRAFLSGHAHDYMTERWINTKDGRPICIALVISAVRDMDGQPEFFSALVSDMTEYRHAELRLQESQEGLRRLQDELAHIGRVNDLGEMAAAIAHEVNQPLTAIANYMSVGRRIAGARPGDPGDLPGILQKASEQALRAGHIIKRMRSFIERREQVRHKERIGPLIDSAIDLMRIGLGEKRVEIIRTIGNEKCEVNVDSIQIQQVLLILMRNAVEAFGRQRGRHKSRISVSSKVDQIPQTVTIFIADNGPGLSPEAAQTLFQPFVTSKPGNMGIGLSIAKRLLEQHGGRLSLVESRKGATIFSLQLPLAIDEPPAVPAP